MSFLMWALAGKVLSLFIAIAYGSAWAVKAARGQAVAEMQTFLATVGIVGFVTLQWLI